MPYPAKAVANYFLDLAEQTGKTVDPMQLQKLVYFAHGWHLALTGQPLLQEQVEAWRYGPVVPTLYHAFKRCGSGPITIRATDMRIVTLPTKGRTATLQSVPASLDEYPDAQGRAYVKTLLTRVWKIYGDYTALQLSQLTHEPGGPWDQTRRANPDRLGTDISDQAIRDYFVAKVRANASPGLASV